MFGCSYNPSLPPSLQATITLHPFLPPSSLQAMPALHPLKREATIRNPPVHQRGGTPQPADYIQRTIAHVEEEVSIHDIAYPDDPDYYAHEEPCRGPCPSRIVMDHIQAIILLPLLLLQVPVLVCMYSDCRDELASSPVLTPTTQMGLPL